MKVVERAAAVAILCGCLCHPLTLDAEALNPKQTVVVSATGYSTRTSRVGNSVSVFSAEELERKQYRNIADVLREVPGVDVARSGGRGGNASVFMRGANPEHTLILVDGIELNDPSSPSRAANVTDISLDNIEQIEILRGPQSVIHGSDALGGVINIITRKGEGQGWFNALAEGGSFGTFNNQITAGSKLDRGDISFSFSRQDSDSFSAADEDQGNSEDDHYENTSFSGRVGIQASQVLKLNLIARLHDARTEIDNFGGVGGDDPNRLFENSVVALRTEAQTSLLDGDLQGVLGVSFTEHDREDSNDPHPGSIEYVRSDFEGKLWQLDLIQTYPLGDDNLLSAGFEWEQEAARSTFVSDGAFGAFESAFDRRYARTTGYFLQDQFWLGPVETIAGVRVDDHSEADTALTWRVTGIYSPNQNTTTFRASAGSGFKAPSLYQLYSGSFGNPDLQPEESLGVDFGVEQKLLDNRATVGVTLFWNEFDDLITTDPDTFVYMNINRAETKGVETSLSLALLDPLSLRGSFTYTESKDRDTDKDLLRRPDLKFSAEAIFEPTEETSFSLVLVHLGDRDDIDFSTFPSTDVELDSYTLLNFVASWDITPHGELYGRVENILDQDYQEVLGYGSAGLSGYAGFKYTL